MHGGLKNAAVLQQREKGYYRESHSFREITQPVSTHLPIGTALYPPGRIKER
ncbi:hypothetical protein HMPREF1987_00095 [Peptostreptococcaceae bacterium oral taxon 113 str. W5053]|nr:hypothetical protein HMPREF1987_00095 [Peptostreptococcaceae bacterium oral taxon 113 str. W5053]